METRLLPVFPSTAQSSFTLERLCARCSYCCLSYSSLTPLRFQLLSLDLAFSFELPGDVVLGTFDELESCLASLIGGEKIIVGEVLAGELELLSRFL